MSTTKETVQFIKGKRIYLREVRSTDVNEAYYRWMNDEEVTQYLETRFYPYSIEALHDYVGRMLHDRANVFLAIVLTQGDRHIGNIKLGPVNWIHRFADVGLLIGEKDCWGQGYGSEAIQVAAGYAFRVLNLRRLCASCYANNTGSLKSFLKAGWSVEGERIKHFRSNDVYVNQILMGLVRPDEDA